MPKQSSPFQIILLAIFGAIGVVAVLIFAFLTASGTNSGIGSVTIWGTFDQTAVANVLRQAAETDTRLSQVTYEQKSDATYESDLANALASGKGPDLFFLRNDHVVLDSSKILTIPYTQFPQSQFSNTFVNGTDVYLSQSGVAGVPILVDPLVLYWNRDLLARSGITQPPQYWDELPSLAQRLTERTDTGSITKSAIALGQYRNIDAAKDILTMLIMQAGGKITTRDTGGHLIPTLSVGTSASGAMSALRFFTEFADPSKNDYSWNRSLPDARQAFAASDLAFYIGYASEEPLIRASNPNLDFAIAAVPQVRGGQNVLGTGAAYALAIPKVGANQTGALTAAFLIASPSVSAALSESLGIPSARRDAVAAASAATNATLAQFQTASSSAQIIGAAANLMRSWEDPDPQQTGDIFRGMIEDTESGAVRLEDAIQRADQQMAQILGL